MIFVHIFVDVYGHIYIYKREREIYEWSFMDKLADFPSVDQRIKFSSPVTTPYSVLKSAPKPI